MGAILRLLGGIGLGALNGIFSVFSAGMNGALSLAKSAMNAALQYHQQGIEFARSMGMSLQQAQAYTTVLTNRAAELGFKYGVAADAVKELQQNLAEATGKAAMLNDVDAEKFLQMNKLVGSNVTRQFTSEIMNHLGGQIHTVEGAVSKAYSTAAKSGLNAAQFSEKVAKNLSMANKLSFRNGVNGIIKMTALSEKLGFNLQSVEAAANKFMDLDSAIESSAQLQMLGGAAGAYGSNPLTMAYEANYDPEAFTERMTKTLGGYATFDAKTGMANVNGMNRDFVKNIAQAMGISMDEAMSIAKKQAEIKYKESSGLNDKVRAMNLSDEQKDYLINASYVGKDGNLKMTDANGKERDVTSFSPDEIEKMMSLQNMSDEEIMKQQALTLTSINEKLTGLETSSVAELAKGVNQNLDRIYNLINDFGPKIIQEAQNLAPKIGEAIGGITDFISKHGDAIATGIHKIGNFLGFIYDHWEIFLGVFLGIKFISWFAKFSGILGRGFNLLSKGGRAVTRSARAAARGTKGFFKGARTKFGDIKAGYQLNREAGSGRISSFFKGIKDSGHFSKLTKFVEKIGSAGKSLANGISKFSKLVSGAFSKAASGISKAAKGIGKAATKVGSKVGGAAKGVGKVLTKVGSKALTKVGGAALAGATSLGLAGLDVTDIRKQMDELTKSYKEGKVSQDEYNKKMRELSNQKNEAIGSGVGGVVGGALGSLLDEFLGPFGTIIGAMVGDAIGGFVGSVWNNISNTVSDFWNGTVRNLAESLFGKAGTAVVDAIGSFVDGYTNGVGVVLETILSGIGDFLGGAWDGIKTIFGGTWDGIVKIFHGDLTGFFDIIVAQAKGTWKIISSAVVGVWKVVTAPFLGLWEIFKGFGNAMVDLWGGVVAVYENVAEGISTAWDATVGAFSAVGQWIQDRWNGAVDAIGSVFTSIGEFFRPVIDVANGIFTAIGNAWSTVTSFVQGIFDGVASAWNSVIGFFRRVGEGIAKAWSAVCDAVGNLNPIKWVEKGLDALGDLVGFAEGGVVGGDSPTGDKIMARLNSGEMVLNKDQQNMLFGLFSKSTSLLSDLFSFNPFSILTNSNDVKAKPVGEKEYIYTPNGNSNNGVTELTVRDININVNGTIKLDAGNFAKNIDINQLLNDSSFVSSLKEIIKSSINNDMNGGRFMNDNATLRGSLGTTTYWGR